MSWKEAVRNRSNVRRHLESAFDGPDAVLYYAKVEKESDKSSACWCERFTMRTRGNTAICAAGRLAVVEKPTFADVYFGPTTGVVYLRPWAIDEPADDTLFQVPLNVERKSFDQMGLYDMMRAALNAPFLGK